MSRTSILSVIRQRNPFFLWLGQLVSSIGDNFEYIALLALAYQISGSTLVMSGVMVSFMVPNLIVSLFSSVLVDRWDRRRTMIISDLIRGLIIIAPPVLLLTGRLELWHLYLYSALFGSTTPFFNNANSAILPALVTREEYQPMNSLMQTSTQIANVVGLAVGGVAIAFLGIANAYFFDAFTFFFSALTIFFIRLPATAKTGRASPAGPARFWQSWWSDFREGLRFYRVEQTLLHLLLIFSVINFAFGPTSVLLLPFAKDSLGVGVEGYGWMMSILCLGMFLGTLIMGTMGTIRNRRLWIFVGAGALGLLTALLPFTNFFPAALAVMIFIGFSLPVVNVISATIFQEKVPDHLRGRVFGVRNVISQALMPVSTALGGLLADWIGVSWTITACGLLAIFTVVAGLFIPSLAYINLPALERGVK